MSAPTVEATCLAHGVRLVTFVKCNNVTFANVQQRITTNAALFGGSERAAAHCCAAVMAFDAALSISSFNHDGLGRYSDPPAANADVAVMATTSRSMREARSSSPVNYTCTSRRTSSREVCFAAMTACACRCCRSTQPRPARRCCKLLACAATRLARLTAVGAAV